MSSFRDPHYMYLFALRSGGYKLAYGKSPEDALEVLRMRLMPEEMANIDPGDCLKINQREMQKYIHLLK